MNKKFKCIIFDLDGTLIDSGPDLVESLNYVLKNEGLGNINHSILGSLVGGGAEMMIRKGFQYLNSKIDENKVQFYIDQFLKYYFKKCTHKTKLYKGVEKTLKCLKESKIKICLCTNKKQYLTNKIIKGFNLDKYFDLILGSSEKFKMKPDIQMLEYCSKQMEVNYKECVMVGDSENDIIPANILEMTSIFVRYGYGELNGSVVADFSIDKIYSVLDI